MLNLLVKYAYDHHQLSREPGFSMKTVRWAIMCDTQGRFLGEAFDLRDPEERNSRGRAFRKCPDLTQPELTGGSEDRCHFLIETARVGTLYKTESDDEKTHKKHLFFVSLLRQASEARPDLGLIASMLEDAAVLSKIHAALEAREARPNDKVTFCIRDEFPVESDCWHDWWRRFRVGLAGGKAPRLAMPCLITGELAEPLRTHPKVRGIDKRAGGSPFDTLVSFDKAAFSSFGLAQSANAAISEAAAYAYRVALEDLLAHHAHLIAGVQVVHWFAKRIPPADDPFELLFRGTEEQEELWAQKRAADLVESIRKGEREDLADNHYYALTLSGAARRIMVRDWMEGQFEDLVESVSAWFHDLQITSLNGDTPAKDPSIERAITALLPERKQGQAYGDWIKQIGAERTHLWRAALNKNLPIPFSALARVVTLNARFHQTGELEQAAERGRSGAAISALYARMGLMKAYHLRKKGESYLMPYLNEEHPDPAYHCGRLMAVYAALQHAALPNVDVGVVQRYYAAASATPGLILGRLARLSTFHLNKLDSPGLAHSLESKLADIWARIADRPPTTLTLEEQSLFALGYYQQMAADRKGKPKVDDQNTETKED